MAQTIEKLSLALDQRNNRRANGWVLGIVASIIVGFIVWAGSTAKDTVVKVERLEVRIQAIEERLIKVEEWQDGWVEHGLLHADVLQNARIDEIDARLDRIGAD